MDTTAAITASETWVLLSQAAERAGVSRATVISWAERGLIASRRLPHTAFRVRLEDVDRLLAAATHPAAV